VCQPETSVAATKINPLHIAETKLERLEELCRKQGRVLRIIPLKKKKVGIIITGNEVFNGLVEDRFGEILENKVEALGSAVNNKVIVPDDEDVIGQAIKETAAGGSDVIVVAGGLSVDPDDVSLEGVERSGARIVSYGAPVMPGAMFLYAELGNIPILGAPGAVIFNQATIIDLILPRVLAGERITRKDIVALGHGGLCLNCEGCNFPVCPFGK
jgi:molybdenum cofactor synthesis domain-containing protein